MLAASREIFRRSTISCSATSPAIPLSPVEHPCYKCGATIEEGTPFCPQCNAPQIRVSSVASDLPLEVSQAEQHSGSYHAGIQWSQGLPSAALAGLAAAFLMFIPLGAFGLGMIAAGVLSVLFYRKRNPGANLTPALGAKLGAVSGVLGFGMFAVLTALEVAVFHGGGALREAMQQAIEQSAARSADPQVQQMLDYFKSPAGLVLMMNCGLAVVFVAFLVFSSLGGAASAALLRSKNQK